MVLETLTRARPYNIDSQSLQIRNLFSDTPNIAPAIGCLGRFAAVETRWVDLVDDDLFPPSGSAVVG